MHNNIAKHNIIKLACLLAATMPPTSCCTLVSAKTVKIKGTPESVESSSTMLRDGFNFPELIYCIGDDLSYEWLNFSFAKNGTINQGDASYTTKLYKKSPKQEIMFMGGKYHSLDPENADTLTDILKCFGSEDKKTISIGDIWELDQNYTLTVSDIDLNGEMVTLELAKNSDVVEFTVIGSGDTFEYKTDPGSADDAILFNSKTISCSLDETIDLLDDWIKLKLKVSSKGYWSYVYSTKTLDCPECPEVPLIDESGNVDSMASNTVSSTNSHNTGPDGAGIVPVPTATPATTATPEQITKLATAGSVSGISQALPGFGALSLICMLILAIIIRRK